MLSARRLAIIPIKRYLSTQSPQNTLELLKTRTLIRVSGGDASPFLQGLITNDINHLNAPIKSMYSMFLNTKGRILYDAIIYRNNEPNTYLIECDAEISSKLQKMLKMYKIKRKVDINDLSEEYHIYALYNANNNSEQLPKSNAFTDDCLIFKDPRIAQLGCRILTKSSAQLDEKIANLNIVAAKVDSFRNYRWLRYKFGVGEGVRDLPPGECFPLECNCDYLHGVSFHKGCYIGQELTARVHHTGVVRKRLMPLFFSKNPTKQPDERIIHEKVNLGKFRGIEADVGLALIRFEKALKFAEISVGDGVAATAKPDWWPVEASKEQMNRA